MAIAASSKVTSRSVCSLIISVLLLSATPTVSFVGVCSNGKAASLHVSPKIRHRKPSSTMTNAAARLYTSISTDGKQPNQQGNTNNNDKPQPKQKQQIAIIGGGIAGLSCAQTLANSGWSGGITVFDTGRLRPGGRCSSRFVGDRPSDDDSDKPVGATSGPILSKQIIDHAAQILTVPQSGGSNNKSPPFQKFQEQVDQWEKDGIIRRYPTNTVCEIRDDRKGQNPFFLWSLNTKDRPPMYHGTDGNGNIPLAMSKPVVSDGKVDLRQDVWVSPSNGVKYQRGAQQNWKLQANGKPLGVYDELIIAHNGKCADRIMSQTPAKDLHSLLRVNFSPSVPKWGGKKMTLNSIYSLTIAIPASGSLSKALPKDRFVCGFVQNEPTLRFLSCQSRKYPQAAGSDDNVEVWTILSSATFAKNYKAPQEFLPDETVTSVTSLLLQGVERSLKLDTGSLENSVMESRLQLWGAAVPLNVWSSQSIPGEGDGVDGFVYDAEYGVGVCGDWLLEPSIAGAWESGRRLAQHMIHKQQVLQQGKEEKASLSVGLPSFDDSGDNDIGGKFLVSQKTYKAGIGAL